jgi:hypothetical protein
MAYVVPCRLRDALSAMQFNTTYGKKTTKENFMINSKFHHVAKGVCMGLLAITSLSSYAIENGQHDYMHRNVGAVGFDLDGPANPIPPLGLCSGFVISDWAFVTAAHCIITPPPFASWAVTLEPGTPENPVIQPGIFTGDNVFDFPMLVEPIDAIAVHVHPGFEPGSRTLDVAVFEFPPGTFKVRPVRLAEPYYLDELDIQGVLYLRPVGLVGYGMLAETNEGFVVPGYRSRGFSKVSGITDDQLLITPTDVFDARLMDGDSGSPQFISGRAVSLTSTLEELQRLDLPEVLDFLAPFIE